MQHLIIIKTVYADGQMLFFYCFMYSYQEYFSQKYTFCHVISETLTKVLIIGEAIFMIYKIIELKVILF